MTDVLVHWLGCSPNRRLAQFVRSGDITKTCNLKNKAMKKTNKSSNGTSFHGVTIESTVDKLTKVLGEPDYVDNSGEDKVNYSWDLETNEGDVVTLYTWKEYRPIEVDEEIEFHIGGMARNHTILGKQELTELLK
jgi:hypothetical protein